MYAGSVRRWVSIHALALACCGGSTASPPAPIVDGGMSDAPADAGGADASYLACMDSSGHVDPSLKQCVAASDCVIGQEQTDCCGTILYVGLNASSAPAFDACQAAWLAHFPACGCFSENTSTEDGKTAYPGMDAGAPQVRCSGGTCATYRP